MAPLAIILSIIVSLLPCEKSDLSIVNLYFLRCGSCSMRFRIFISSYIAKDGHDAS